MRPRRFACALSIAVLIALSATARTDSLRAQSGPSPMTIPSLTEQDEGLVVTRVSQRSGFPTFAATQRQGILLAVAADASAEDRALAFIDSYGKVFGLESRGQVQPMGPAARDHLGIEHVRLQQLHERIPVRAGEFVVHLKGARVVAANGAVVAEVPDTVVPSVAPSVARNEARLVVGKYVPAEASGASYSEPRLEILNRGALEAAMEPSPSRLAWFVEASGPALREFIWVDAKTGGVLLHFSQLPDARNRLVYDANHSTTLPGTLVRSEGGGATGDSDTDLAYAYAGATYDYFWASHGRDSYDNAGAALISSVHYGVDYQNAFWNGDLNQMVYGDGFASADDVVAHELTHAVTEHAANLLYYMQSGALNESFSDIYGETVDLTDGLGNDSTGVRWLIGEDLSIGAGRNMMTPWMFSDPGKMSDSLFYCGTSDGGGVHTNSGVPNHAYALMVDGGPYNGITINGIGLTKAARIEYRALTTYLTSGSGFKDAYDALVQSCSDLVGTAGITSSDCGQVLNALVAVQMAANEPCAATTPAPALCPVGSFPTSLFSDGFETSLANWTMVTTSSANWERSTLVARSGVFSVNGPDASFVSDHSLMMTSPVALPAGARLYFDHLYLLETGFDGGVLEYSTDGGTTWNDAASLIEAGKAYTGTLSTAYGNPLGGRQAFTGISRGFTGTRVNLSTLAGSGVRFRFRIGTDSSYGGDGWFVDNVRIYTCGAPVTAFTTSLASVTVPEGGTATFQVRLSAAPPGPVTVTVTRVSGDTDISVQDGLILGFTPANFNTYQTVTLAGAQDPDTSNGVATIRLQATGLVDKDITATEQDDGVVRPGPGVTTLAGKAGSPGKTDGTGGAARFFYPDGIAVDSSGTLYVADTYNHTIRKVTPTGEVTTLAGLAGTSGSADGTGSAARFYYPHGASVDSGGTVYLADRFNHTIRKVTPAGEVTTLAGLAGTTGSTDGTGSAARFLYPEGTAVDTSGNVYVADYLNNTIRKITPAGEVTTLAGLAGTTGSTDGTGSTARFYQPRAVTVDVSGTIFVGDSGNHLIRKVTPSGVVTTLAGVAGAEGSDDGIGNTARFDNPSGVAADCSGALYVADYNNHTIRKVTSSGAVTTVAGMAGVSGSTDGVGSAARFYHPNSVAATCSGIVYVVDESNHTIRKISMSPSGTTSKDFDGDGKSDVLWRHTTRGEVWLWPMNGAARTAESHVRTVADTNWEIRGLGDQTGDGKADILWRNKVTGMIYFWPMNGSTPIAETYVGIVDPAYDIVGTGDFNGDGKSDILWRHTTTGAVWIWLMNGATPASEVYVDRVDLGYVIKGLGDLDGDSKADIVWHHATQGDVWVWLMNGTTRLSQTWVATVPDTGYQIQAVADFDGNSKADILWWHAISGGVWMWTMNGTTRQAETWVATVPDTGYRIAGTGDYDGNGKADILWHHATRGEVWMWLMNGTTRLSETWVATVPEVAYQIVKAK